MNRLRSVSPFVLLCTIGLCAIFSSTISKSPVLPLFAHDLGARDALIGFIAAASTVVGILLSIPAGALSDIFGRKKVIVAAAFIFASAPLLYLGVHTAPQLVLVRIYHGCATAIFGPVAMALVADLYRAQRGEKMGWYSSSTLIGRSLAPFLGGILLTVFSTSMFWHYRSVYALCAIAGMVSFALALFLPRQSPVPAEGAEQSKKSMPAAGKLAQMQKGLGEVLRHRGILVTSGAEAVQYFGFGAFEVFVPLYAKSIGLHDWMIGILLGSQVLALTFSKPLLGKVSDAHERRTQIMLGLLGGALGLLCLPFCKVFWLLLIACTLFGVTMATVTSSTAALVADYARSTNHGSALGVMSTIMDIGHAGGPMIAGMIIGGLGYTACFAGVGAFFAVTAAIYPALAGASPHSKRTAP
ncbi:MAG: MFS transporter [Chitinivibrionales bacterium]|nr:MFS transporter [Chitinivibrionales bacterium]